MDEDGSPELSEPLELSRDGRRPLRSALWLCCDLAGARLSNHHGRIDWENSWTDWLGHGGEIGRVAMAHFSAGPLQRPDLVGSVCTFPHQSSPNPFTFSKR